MASPIEVILVPTIMILLGVFLKQRGFLKQSDRDLLSKIVLYIALPSMIFINLYNADISSNMLFLPVMGFILTCILFAIAYIYCRVKNFSKKTTWTILIAASIMNTGFIGFPVSLGVFGNEGFINAVFYDLATSAWVVLYGIILASKFGGDRKQALRKALTFTPVWAMILALIFNFFNIPLVYVAENTLNYFGQATIPLIMLSLGLSLDFGNVKNYISPSIAVAIIKLVIAPLVMIGLASLFRVSGMAFNIAVLEAGMSTAGNALVLAIEYGLDADMMGSVIFTNVVLSVFTLTAIIVFLG